MHNEYKQEVLKLEATIACLKSERDSELILKDESDKHITELNNELDKIHQEMDILKENHYQNVSQLKETFQTRIKLLEKKSEKLAADNFEFVVENVRFFTCKIVMYFKLYLYRRSLERR